MEDGVAVEDEYEVTCGFVFDGELFTHIKSALLEKCKTLPKEETADVYAHHKSDGDRFRAVTGYVTPSSGSVGDVEIDYRRFDRKRTLYTYESQTPYVQKDRGRVLFIGCTYKESTEVVMTDAEWKRTVVEDHASGHYTRVHRKRRLCFYRDAFKDVAPYTRVSIGEKSSYGGTLEARSACNSVYYMEIELETDRPLDSANVKESMNTLCNTLFQLLPYDLVRAAMLATNSCSVQRERIDSMFDTFKRQFRDYRSCAADLRQRGCHAEGVDFFLMPKWDGVRAVGLYYCDGYLTVKDACGRMSSFRTVLPFDNDMILQLEVVGPKLFATNESCSPAALPGSTDSEGYYYVVTELLAVLVKSQNTLYHVYGRNNVIHDTGRNIGNVVTSITIKTQFDSDSHVCSLYRPVTADTSLRVLSTLTEKRDAEQAAVCPAVVNVTSVVNITCSSDSAMMSVQNVLDLMDDMFHPAPTAQRSRRGVLSQFERALPVYLRSDARFQKDCEGLILAYTERPAAGQKCTDRERYGYFKLKHTDTVDLELNLVSGSLTSADQTAYTAQGLPTLDSVRNWAERPAPIKNQRIIVECYYDGGNLVFLKDRSDKSRPDSDSKIKATNELIYNCCRVNTMGLK